MPTYFKPLRRKIGIVTLAIACFFTADWVKWICLPQNEDVFTVSGQYAIPFILLSAYLLLSKPWPGAVLEPPTMTHDGGPLPNGSDSSKN